MIVSRYSNCRAAEVMEMPRSCSIVIQSETVARRPALPWTAPAMPIAFAWRASASVSVDLPESGWEMTAKVRRRAASFRTSAGVCGPEFTAPVYERRRGRLPFSGRGRCQRLRVCDAEAGSPPGARRRTLVAMSSKRRRQAPEEQTRIARDPERGAKRRRLLPLLIAALVAAPLLWFSIAFSVSFAQIAVYASQLGASTGTIVGMVVLSLGGFLALVAALTCLVVGWRRDEIRWRWRWAIAAMACAAAMPIAGLVSGVLFPPV